MIDKQAVIKRLKKVEGQIKGIEKMIEEEKFCEDILIQIAAARAALNSIGGLILENYVKNCIYKVSEGELKEEELNKVLETVIKYAKK